MSHRERIDGFGVVMFVVWTALVASPAMAQHGAVDGEWHVHGADNGTTKYSSLDQIRTDNVS